MRFYFAAFALVVSAFWLVYAVTSRLTPPAQAQNQLFAVPDFGTAADTLVFRGSSGARISVNVATGEVQYAHLGTPDEAARVFWEAVATLAPLRCTP